jgi:hypothetical protein
MAKLSTSGPLQHVDDATFRAWGSELSAALDSLGVFPKSADSGQVNWATVTRPSPGNYVYEVRYLNDSRHATAPIYVKLEYGTDPGTANNPSMRISIGKGSNGAGTVTNQFLTPNKVNPNLAPASGANYPSMYCGVDGFIGYLFKSFDPNQYGFTSLILQRTVDDSGAPTDEGFAIFLNRSDQANYGPRFMAWNYTTGYLADVGASYGGRPPYVLVPIGAPTGVIGSPAAYQMYRHQACIPKLKNWLFTLSSDVSHNLSSGTTFQCAPVGTAMHTYIVCNIGHLGYSAYDRVCMLWE